MMQRCNGRDDAGVMFGDHAKQERDDRAYNRRCYRNLILRSVVMFFAGMILKAFLQAFGLGAFLFSAALFFLGGLYFNFL